MFSKKSLLVPAVMPRDLLPPTMKSFIKLLLAYNRHYNCGYIV